MKLMCLNVILLIDSAVTTSSPEVHLYAFDQQEAIEKCKNNLQHATEVILKGYVRLPERTLDNETILVLEVERYSTNKMKQYCSINLNDCTASEFPSNCNCELQTNGHEFDFIFNFTNQIIFSLAEARMRLLSREHTSEEIVSSTRQMPAIYTSLNYRLQINGMDIDPNDCIFKIHKDNPTVRFCCDANQFSCQVSIILEDNELTRQSSCAEINVNDHFDFSVSSSFFFKYEICQNKESMTIFQCQPIFVSRSSTSLNEKPLSTNIVAVLVGIIIILVSISVIPIIKFGKVLQAKRQEDFDTPQRRDLFDDKLTKEPFSEPCSDDELRCLAEENIFVKDIKLHEIHDKPTKALKMLSKTKPLKGNCVPCIKKKKEMHFNVFKMVYYNSKIDLLSQESVTQNENEVKKKK